MESFPRHFGIRTGLLCMAVALFMQGCSPSLEFDKSSLKTNSEVVTCNSELIELVFDHTGGKASVNVKSNKSWTVEAVNGRADDWLKFDPASGSKSGSVSISVAQNTSHEERSATLTVSGAGEMKTTIRIIQKQDDALIISTNKVEMDENGGEFELQVKHNISYTLEIDDASSAWIHKSATKAMSTDRVTFAVEPNSTIYPRQGQIRISSSLGNEIINVYQTGEDPVLVLSALNITATDQRTEFTVDVSSNTKVEYSISADWIKEIVSKTMSTDRYTFAIEKNESYESRTAQIIFSSSESGLKEAVTVTQAQKDALVASKNNYQVGSDGANITVKLGHNVRYTTVVGSEWIREIKTKSFVTDELTFAIDRNETYDVRYGEILFTSEDNSLRQAVTIEQAQKDALFVSADTIHVSNKGEAISVEVSSNVEYSVSIRKGSDWLSRVQTRGLTTSTYTFMAASSDVETERYADVVFSDGKLSQTVVVAQPPMDQIRIIPNGDTNISFYGGEAGFKIIANIEYTIDEDLIPSWATLSGADGAYRLTLEANSDPEVRTVTIKAVGVQSDAEASIEIKQEGRPADSYLNKMNYGAYNVKGRNYEGAHTTSQTSVIKYSDHYAFRILLPSEGIAVVFPSLAYSIKTGDTVSFKYIIYSDAIAEERNAKVKVEMEDGRHLWMKADNGEEFIIKKVEVKK